MYVISIAGFLAAACNPNRIIDTAAVLELPNSSIPLGVLDIMSYKITTSSTAGKVFAPGSFVAGQLEMSLVEASSEVSGIDFKSTPVNKISVKAGIQVDSTMRYVPMGNFYPEKDGVNKSNSGQVTIKATNLPPVLSNQFNSSSIIFPCMLYDALTKIAGETGLEISLESDFPNLWIELTETFSMSTTYREALMYFAEAVGAFLFMGRHGEICLKKVFSDYVDLGCTLDDNYLFSVSKQESSVKPFEFINIKGSKDDLGVTQSTGNTTGCVYEIVGNPLTYGQPEIFLEGLVEPTIFEEFYPSKISLHGRPDLDVGDVVEYVYKGSTYVLPICTHVFEYNGGFKTTLESIGSDKLKTSSSESGFKASITALKQNINALVRDLEKTQSTLSSVEGDVTNVSTLLQTANELSGRITKIEGDIEKFSGLTWTAEQLRIDFGTLKDNLDDTNTAVSDNQKLLTDYFDFQPGSLTIGVGSSNIKLRLANDKIQFLKDGSVEVAYLSEGKLYVTDGHFLTSLVLGNFEFTPRTNGNLSLRRRG